MSWTQDDKSVEAFADLIEAIKDPLSNFNKSVWNIWLEEKSDFLSLMFAFGTFVVKYDERSQMVAGEDKRTTLHHALNLTLKQKNIQDLLAKLGGQKIDASIKGVSNE